MAPSTNASGSGGDAQPLTYLSKRGRDRILRYEDYTVGWICALPLEMTAAEAMLDQIHGPLPRRKDDSNAYTLGNIDAHNIVIACLPKGQYGTNNAATVASNMKRSFPSITTRLMVGIGGGAPGLVDIRLGDIVVGTEVVQYDLGKAMPDGKFLRTGLPVAPPLEISTVVSKLEADHGRSQSRVPDIIFDMLKSNPSMLQYARPKLHDRLFRSSYNHASSANGCIDCDEDAVQNRIVRASHDPKIYYGKIASGNQVIKDGHTRDRLAKELGVICFEMEAAGLMSSFPCLVIRGICDYSDSHKNKEWQKYAAATAAAYAKELLSAMPVTEVTQIDSSTNNPDFIKCMRDLFVTDPSEDKEALKRKKGHPAPKTCEWMLETEELTDWLEKEQSVLPNGQSTSILWLYGNPGTGKSTMAIFLAEKLSEKLSDESEKSLAYFFCDSNFENRTKATCVIRGLLWQLVHQHPRLMDYILKKYEERGLEVFQSFDALWSIFTQMVEDESTGQKLCIIDALDECEKESQELLLQQLQETFLHQHGGLKIKILITSRPYPEIDEQLRHFARSVNLASFPESKEDIDRCIDQRIMELTKEKRYTETVQEQIKNILRDKAEGTFLWIGLACKELRNIPSRRAVSFLRGLPRGLHEIFNKLLQNAIQGEETDEATIRLILSVVAVSLRPLTLIELANMCQLYSTEDLETRTQFTKEEVDSCRLMVVVQDEKVLLLHKSVKDFLMKDFINENEANASVAFRCIDQLIQAYHTKSTTREEIEYATTSWGDHARQSGSKFCILDSQTEFFDHESPCRESWLDNLRLLPRWMRFPENFSILHVAARWGIPAIIDYICSHSPSSFRELLNYENYAIFSHMFTIITTRTPLEEAIEAGHVQIISRLLDESPIITKKAFQTAAENESSGLEIIKLLLGHQRGSGPMEDFLLEAAASNRTNGYEIACLLLHELGSEINVTENTVLSVMESASDYDIVELVMDQCSGDIVITEEFLEAAMRNGNGPAIFKRLLDKGGHVATTANLVKAAAGFYRDGPMRILLDKYGDNIIITEEIMEKAARNSSLSVTELLLKSCANAIVVMKKLVEAAPLSISPAVMGYLLEEHADEIIITEEVVEVAACIINADTMKYLLEQHGREIATFERILVEAATNLDTNVMGLLLERYDDRISMNDDMIKSIMKIGKYANIKMVLDKYGDKITPTEDVINAASANYDTNVMVLILEKYDPATALAHNLINLTIKEGTADSVMLVLEKYGNKRTILPDTIKYAARNRRHGFDIITLLLRKYGDCFTITEDIIVAGLKNSAQGLGITQLLLNKCNSGIKITKGMMKAAFKSHSEAVELTSLLLKHCNNDFKVTEDLMKAAVGSFWNPIEITSLLFEQYGSDIGITEGILEVAAEGFLSHSVGVMSLLLEQGNSDINITTRVIMTASENQNYGRDILSLLFEKHGDEITITEDILRAAAANEEEGMKIMELIAEFSGNDFNITESLVHAACLHGQIEMLHFFQSKKSISITEEQNNIANFYNAIKRGNMTAVEKMLQGGQDPDIKNTFGRTPLSVATINGHHAIVELLLRTNRDNVNSTNRAGRSSPIASETEDTVIIKIPLRSNGVDVNSQDNRGSSPLILAAARDHRSIVASLLEAGADPNLIDNDGGTALSRAQSNGHEEIVKLVSEYLEMNGGLKEQYEPA